ncbi:unnamed protein product, partial [Discosporangium mesarthrocarpum]
MFLVAVARPRKLSDGEKYQELMVNKVVPAIKARMPAATTRTIFVQQDGALSHTKQGGGKWWRLHCSITQPPSSPDLNVLGLTFFHSIQRLEKDAGVGTAGEPPWRRSMCTRMRPWSVPGAAFLPSSARSWGARVTPTSPFLTT